MWLKELSVPRACIGLGIGGGTGCLLSVLQDIGANRRESIIKCQRAGNHCIVDCPTALSSILQELFVVRFQILFL